jgi:predicted ATPase
VIDGDPERALEAATEAARRSESCLPLYDAITGVLEGWARAELGEADAGVAQVTAAMADMEATGAWMVDSYYLGLLAEAQRRAARRTPSPPWTGPSSSPTSATSTSTSPISTVSAAISC